MNKLTSVEQLEQLRKEIVSKKDADKLTIAICTSTGCEALGSQEVLVALNKELKAQGLDGKVEIRETGCLGFCEQGPRLVIYPQGAYYFKVKAEDVPAIVSKTLLKKEIIDSLTYTDSVTSKTTRNLAGCSLLQVQNRLLLEDNANVNLKRLKST
jgi:NADH-quinone oxidoreductase subunit F